MSTVVKPEGKEAKCPSQAGLGRQLVKTPEPAALLTRIWQTKQAKAVCNAGQTLET